MQPEWKKVKETKQYVRISCYILSAFFSLLVAHSKACRADGPAAHLQYALIN